MIDRTRCTPPQGPGALLPLPEIASTLAPIRTCPPILVFQAQILKSA